jgi:hypothetical protein
MEWHVIQDSKGNMFKDYPEENKICVIEDVNNRFEIVKFEIEKEMIQEEYGNIAYYYNWIDQDGNYIGTNHVLRWKYLEI